MPVLIESYEAPWRFTPWLHKTFAGIYLLLVVRFFVAVYEGPTSLFVFKPMSVGMQLFKRAVGILDGPFSYVLAQPDFESNVDLYTALILSISIYALIHYGMTMKVATEGKITMADRILKMCKAMFFVVGTLMLLLIVARMGVMLYDDLTVGRLVIGVPAAK